jgi:hypothetical protein
MILDTLVLHKRRHNNIAQMLCAQARIVNCEDTIWERREDDKINLSSILITVQQSTYILFFNKYPKTKRKELGLLYYILVKFLPFKCVTLFGDKIMLLDL